MKFFDMILLVIMLGLFVFSFNLVWQNVPGQAVDYEDYVANLTVDARASSVAQFYPNMRYEDEEISYTIEEACNEKKIESVYSALAILEEKTMLNFVEREDGELTYLCTNEAPESDNKNHYVAGEGGPTSIINTTLFSLIQTGQVSLYREERCDTPQVALHETLHALGFDHVTNKKDIMYPITECDQEINQDMITAIDEIYSIPADPDLGIEYVKANQTGRFLNFYITIANYGLRDSSGAMLEIFVDGQSVKEFDLGTIKIGTRKFLNVQNMKTGDSDVDVVRFVLNLKDDDLYNDNNVAELYLKSE